jgi:hypothetical protein
VAEETGLDPAAALDPPAVLRTLVPDDPLARGLAVTAPFILSRRSASTP